MSNNQQAFKERVAPEWYCNGPVKVFTAEEIAEYEKNIDPMVQVKMDYQAGLDPSEIRFLDNIKQGHAELEYAEIMEAPMDGGARE